MPLFLIRAGVRVEPRPDLKTRDFVFSTFLPRISQYLMLNDLMNLSMTSKSTQQQLENPLVWEQAFSMQFGYLPTPSQRRWSSWKEECSKYEQMIRNLTDFNFPTRAHNDSAPLYCVDYYAPTQYLYAAGAYCALRQWDPSGTCRKWPQYHSGRILDLCCAENLVPALPSQLTRR